MIKFLLLTCLLGSATWAAKSDNEEKKPVVVITQDVRNESFYETLKYVGNLLPYREVAVFSYIDGTIEKKFKENGAKVKKGAVLATVKNITPGYNFSDHQIKAPISGTITDFFEEEGTYVQKMSAVMKVADTSQWRVAVPVLQEDLVKLDLNSKVLVQVKGLKEKVEARLLRVSPNVNSTLGTTLVEFVLPKKAVETARLGMMAEVQVRYNRQSGISLDEKYVLEDRQGSKHIFVLKKDQTVEKRKLKLGVLQEGRYKIDEGLSLGETVVIQSAERLRSGKKVSAKTKTTESDSKTL